MGSELKPKSWDKASWNGTGRRKSIINRPHSTIKVCSIGVGLYYQQRRAGSTRRVLRPSKELPTNARPEIKRLHKKLG